MRLHLSLEIAVNAVLQRHRLTIAQLTARLITQPTAVRLNIPPKIAQFINPTTVTPSQRLQLILTETLDLRNHLLRILGIPTDRIQNRVLLRRRQLDLTRLQHLPHTLAKHIEIRRLLATDRLHQLPPDPNQLTLTQPQTDIDQLGPLLGIQPDLPLLTPTLNRLRLPFQKPGFIHLIAMLGPQLLHRLTQRPIETQRLQPLRTELSTTTIRPLDAHLVITEITVIENLNGNPSRIAIRIHSPLNRLKRQISRRNLLDMLRRKFAILVTEILTQLAIQQIRIDQLHPTAPRLRLGIAHKPDIGRDAGVIEQIVRQLNDRIQQIVFDQIATDVRLPAARIAGEQTRTIVNAGNARPDGTVGDGLHLARHLHQKQQLPVAGARGRIDGFAPPPIIGQLHLKARIYDLLTLLDVLEFTAPAFAVGRIRQHEIEAQPRELIDGQRRADLDVLRVVALDHHVRLTDGIGLVVDLLAVQIDIAPGRNRPLGILDVVLRLGQHPAAAAGRVVDGHHRRQPVADRVEDQMRHQMDHLTRREVLPGFLIVLLVELADQLLEDIAHAEIRQTGHQIPVRVFGIVRRQIDIRRDELFQHIEQHLLVRHVPHLFEQLEAGDDLLDVVAEPTEILLDIGQQNLLIVGRRGMELLQRPLAGVVEDVTRCRRQRSLIEFRRLHLIALETNLLQNRRLGRLQQRVETTQDHHRQDDITILAANIDIAQTVVSNGPNERDQFVMGGLVHDRLLVSLMWLPKWRRYSE